MIINLAKIDMFNRISNNFKLLNTKRPENRAFEKKLIRDEDSLSDADIGFLKGWSLSGFGVGGVFYMLFRNLYEPIVLLSVTSFLGNFIDTNYSQFLYNSGLKLGFRVSVWLVFLSISAFWLYGIYFLARYSRRLSWNRCEWGSVFDLKKSEKKWFWWNFVASLVLLLSTYLI